MTRRRKAAEKFRGICECGDHAWAEATKGFVILVSPEDAGIIATTAFCATRTGKKNKTFYATSARVGKVDYLHRVILDAAPGVIVDHVNHNGCDNRRSFIRAASCASNSANSRTPSNNISGFKGVSFIKERRLWRADITRKGKHYGLGCFSTPEEAAAAYDEAALKLSGAFALTNSAMGRL